MEQQAIIPNTAEGGESSRTSVNNSRNKSLQLQVPNTFSSHEQCNGNLPQRATGIRCARRNSADLSHVVSTFERETGVDDYHVRIKDQATEREEQDVGCITPTGKEHRIPESKYIECPPAPLKRRPAPMKRRGRHYQNNRRRVNGLLNPPDLQTGPESIRAIFDE
ncbi:hypothetical protein KP509_23G009600 [Ceratopteris richardii]|nr:hypothetical protein KP509_23G009600 [Ceratopteris richardii]